MDRYPETLCRLSSRIAAIACVILNTVMALPANAESPAPLDDADLNCLALNVYYEARNQPLEGQLAVAHVTLNRLEESRSASTVCEIVYKGRDFSWTSDPQKAGKPPRDATSWLVARWVARMAVANRNADPVRGSTYFHSVSVAPRWAVALVRIGRIGDHIFYARKHTLAASISSE
jgi:spore germination cell wall hydrolase CwlJ-like protein